MRGCYFEGFIKGGCERPLEEVKYSDENFIVW
jgi:hypothetical protein